MIATLTYHSIDDSGSAVSVPPAAFNGHVRWMTSGQVRVLPLQDLVTSDPSGDDALAVTFDDGFANSRSAVELLLSHGLVPTVFVVTGHVGKTNAWGGRDQPGIPTLPLLGWADLESLVARGARIEAHTRTHPALTGVSRQQLDDELNGCREDLAVRLGVTSTHFAYPYGDVNDEVARHTAGSYQFAHTTEMRQLDSSSAPARLPRLDAYYFRTASGLEAFGKPSFSRQLSMIRARRRVRRWVSG